MSRYLGEAIQLGYLVDALEPAIHFWSQTLGIGPFFIMPPSSFATLKHHDMETAERDIIAQVALGQSAGMQIELIVPGPAPSTYRDFLDEGRRGLHHIGFACNDFDAHREAALQAGLTPVTEGASIRTRFSYLEGAKDAPAPIVELIEMSPVIASIFDRVRTASIGWDGRDPIRHI